MDFNFLWDFVFFLGQYTARAVMFCIVVFLLIQFITNLIHTHNMGCRLPLLIEIIHISFVSPNAMLFWNRIVTLTIKFNVFSSCACFYMYIFVCIVVFRVNHCTYVMVYQNLSVIAFYAISRLWFILSFKSLWYWNSLASHLWKAGHCTCEE